MIDKRDEYTTRDGRSAYYDPQKMDAIVDERDRLRAELETAQKQVKALERENGLLLDTANRATSKAQQLEVSCSILNDAANEAEAQVAALEAVIRVIPEWRSDGYCGYCLAFPKFTHARDCLLQAALRLTRKTLERN